MAIRTVTTSLTVNFERAAIEGDGFLTLEVDDRTEKEGGLNLGDTSFSPGDSVFILLYKESSVTLDSTFTSAGSFVPSGGTQTKEFNDAKKTTEYLTVANSATANLGHPANNGAVTLEWLGRTKKIGKGIPKMEMMVTDDGVSEVVIDLGTEMVGVIKAQYASNSTAYKLSGVPVDYPVAVVFATGTIGS